MSFQLLLVLAWAYVGRVSAGSLQEEIFSHSSTRSSFAVAFGRQLQQASSSASDSSTTAPDICGSQEYYCGSSDMLLDVAYQAVVGGNCTADTGAITVRLRLPASTQCPQLIHALEVLLYSPPYQ